MKTTVLVCRLWLGAIYLIFGLDYYLHFIPYQPPAHTGDAGAYIAGLKATGYFYPILKTIQIVGGISLLTNRFPAFFAIVLFPVSYNVLLFHTVLVPSGWYMGVLLTVPNLLLGLGYWKYYAPIFTVKPVAGR